MEEAIIRNALEPMARVASSIEEQLRGIDSLDANVAVDLSPLDDHIALGLFDVHLLGRAQIWADVQSAERKGQSARPLSAMPYAPGAMLAAAALGDFEFRPLSFEEAIQFFRDKIDLPAEEFYELADQARSKAFSIRVGATEQVRASIKDILTQAQTDGMGVREFRDLAQEILQRAGIGVRDVNGEPMDPDWYWRTVFKTNLDTSYQAGRWKQMTDPDVTAARPFLQYVSARLPTSRPSHREKHGVILRFDDPFWNKWMPPNGFNCYCTVTTLSEREMRRDGLRVSTKNFVYPDPDEGFAGNPGRTESV